MREAKATGPTYRTTLRATIRNSYSGHYRRVVLDLLAALDFRSNNEAHRPVIQALDLVRRYAGTRLHAYPADEDVPIEGVVRPLWRDAVVEKDPRGGRASTGSPTRSAPSRPCATSSAARRSGSSVPTATATRTRTCRPTSTGAATNTTAALDLPLDADRFIAGLQDEMRAALHRLDPGLPRNPDVRISRKAGGWIT